ncbi:glucose dehydrogenase [Caerostris extrusa]|uniref:Glucose dehydrogenase n=1 Tax=Caerostris extrusa TaxID=172846 RepID=A0AAV4R9U5_CAEEX|nr:glucose dehydrogenase [Caerostris extrusa]
MFPVGGGSAGCALARRLWEDSHLSILMVESGTTAPWISLVPMLAPGLQGYTADWGYKNSYAEAFSIWHAGTSKIKQILYYGMMCCQGFVLVQICLEIFSNYCKQSSWPRGKVLGGSSVLNYLLHMWGAKSDFDNLWNSEGSGWDFESVHGYFKRSELPKESRIHCVWLGIVEFLIVCCKSVVDSFILNLPFSLSLYSLFLPIILLQGVQFHGNI